MFGTYRTILAIWVVLDHNFGLGITSSPAVAGFFCLSGFLMTHLVTTPYRGRVGAFFLNRFLRIYPLYWLAMFGLFYYIGALPPVNWPFIKQVLLINRPGEGLYILPSWAVTTELVFYILIGFGASKTLPRTLAWFGASCAVTVAMMIYLYASGADNGAFIGNLYFSMWSGSLPFSAGALLYHLSSRWDYRPARGLALGVVALASAGAFASFGYHYWHRNDFMMLGIYAAIGAQAPTLLSLFKLKMSARVRNSDDWIGRFSYPLYLVHMSVYGIAIDRHLITPEMTVHNGLIVLGLSLVAAAVSIAVLDAPIQILRGLVRQRRQPVIAHAAA